MIAAGAVLLNLNGTCKEVPEPGQLCGERWNLTPHGTVLLGVGTITSAVWLPVLIVDEVRVARRRSRQVMLTWTIQF